MKYLILITTIVLILYGAAYAWDPYPYPLPIQKVLPSSQCVFAGTVQNAKVIAWGSDDVKAQSEVTILDCLYGAQCKRGQTVTFTFYAQTIKDTYIPMSFPVGQNMLIALKSKCSATHDFESKTTGDGPDSGYLCGLFPHSLQDSPNRQFKCTDMMFNRTTDLISYQKIRDLLNGRNVAR
jgi:hypothetical protein